MRCHKCDCYHYYWDFNFFYQTIWMGDFNSELRTALAELSTKYKAK